MKTVFLENGVFVPYRKQVDLTKNGEKGVFVPYRKQVVLTKNGENDDLHSTHKKKEGFELLRPLKPMKMTQMAGVPQTKPPFAKNTVFATLKEGAGLTKASLGETAQ